MKRLILVLTCLALLSCNKEEGIGGNAAIKGKVMLQEYNDDFSILKNEKEAVNKYVYIVYGDQQGYGNRVRTAYDGSFYFNNLHKGEYKIYAYSESKENPALDEPILKEVSISGNKDVADVGTITVVNNDAKGNATLFGTVREQDGSASYLKPNERVYIVFDHKDVYETYTRTSDEGYFEFTNLPVGDYRIYAYSSNNNVPSGVEAVSISVVVDNPEEEIDLGELLIEK